MIKIYHEYSFRSKQTPGNLVFFENLNIRRGYVTSDILYYFLAFSDIIVAFRKKYNFHIYRIQNNFRVIKRICPTSPSVAATTSENAS